jgi:hypothetical protein
MGGVKKPYAWSLFYDAGNHCTVLANFNSGYCGCAITTSLSTFEAISFITPWITIHGCFYTVYCNTYCMLCQPTPLYYLGLCGIHIIPKENRSPRRAWMLVDILQPRKNMENPTLPQRAARKPPTK